MADNVIVLASGSPRRSEILKTAGIGFEVIKSTCEEKTEESDPRKVVIALSEQKASDVSERVDENRLVLAADTVVSLEGRILTKPADEEDAFRMLRALAGRTHEVYTGVTLMRGRSVLFSFAECTGVELYPMSDEDIRSYIATGEPMDKAGSYGIQGSFMVNVKGISGDYNNVVGLPVARLCHECGKYGIKLR